MNKNLKVCSVAGYKIVITVLFFCITCWLAFHTIDFPGQNITEVNMSSACKFPERLYHGA